MEGATTGEQSRKMPFCVARQDRNYKTINWATLLFLAMDLGFSDGVEFLFRRECAVPDYGKDERVLRGIVASVDCGSYERLCVSIVCWAIQHASIEFVAHLVLECRYPSEAEYGDQACTATWEQRVDALAILLADGARVRTAGNDMIGIAIESGWDEGLKFLLTHHYEGANFLADNAWPERLGPQPPMMELAGLGQGLGYKPSVMELTGLGFAAYFPASVVKDILRMGTLRSRGKCEFRRELRQAAGQCAPLRGMPGADLVLLAAEPWGRHNHHLFTATSKSEVPYLLWIGGQLVADAECAFCSADLWTAAIMPFVVG
jgi:hypothetical protein